MAKRFEQDDAILQNLIDAGCNKETIEQVLLLLAEDKADESFCLLSKHRRQLLAAIHGDQKRIDILDYLIYSIKKERGATNDLQRLSKSETIRA